MAFWGNSFVFNGIPCEDYDLMIYDFGSNSQSAGNFASGVSIIEEALPSRYKPYFYGIKFEKKLEFNMVFGVNQRRIDSGAFLDRYELEMIAMWLTGHDKYLWLEIQQDDLRYVRYNCIVSNLEIIEEGNVPWALKATVVCDSPYAYLYPQEFQYDVAGTATVEFFNESGHNGYYKPIIEFELSDGNGFSITNLSDNNRTLSFSGTPSSISKIRVDNDRCIITNDQNLNAYPYFNFKFLRLLQGENKLVVKGNGILKIICEFPVNVGG